MPKILWGSKNLTSKNEEAQKLKQIMHGFRVKDLPPPAVIHGHDPAFKKFNHKSFGNVYQNIKKNMLSADSSVHGPGIDGEEEGESWVCIQFFYFSLLLLTLLMPHTSQQTFTTCLTIPAHSQE